MYAVMQVNGPHKVSLFPFLTQAKMLILVSHLKIERHFNSILYSSRFLEDRRQVADLFNGSPPSNSFNNF